MTGGTSPVGRFSSSAGGEARSRHVAGPAVGLAVACGVAVELTGHERSAAGGARRAGVPEDVVGDPIMTTPHLGIEPDVQAIRGRGDTQRVTAAGVGVE